MTTKRTTLAYVLTGLVGCAILAALVMLFAHASPARAGGQSVGCIDMISNLSVVTGCRSHATTTPVYLATGAATTTMVANIGNASSVSLNLAATASTTSTVFTWTVARSDNGIDWYFDDILTTSGSISTHSAGPILNSWTPATTATTSKSVVIPTNAARYIRVGFQAQGAPGAIYPQLIPQNQITN